MMPERLAETGHVLPKLTLSEVFPLYPFLMRSDRLRCIEVGGNVGLWCEAFFGVFGPRVADYQVFEPLPGNLARFRNRLERHIVHQGQVSLHQLCAGDSEGEVTLHYDAEVTALASIPLARIDLDGTIHENRNEMTVSQVRLDTRITEPVDLIKIDTEGYELQVLAGTEDSLRSGRIRNVIMEFGFHQNALGQSFRHFFELFSDLGLQVYRQEANGDFFGFHRIYKARWYDEVGGRQYMVLASRNGPHPDYHGPPVVGEAQAKRQLIRKTVGMIRRVIG